MPTIARYTVLVSIARAVDLEDAPYCVENRAKRDLEREILRACRRLDGDVDCEVLTAEIAEEKE